MDIYTLLDSANKNYTYMFAAIMLFLIYYFRSKDVKLNLLLALAIGVVVVYYISERNEKIHTTEEKKAKVKLDAIRPPTKYFEGKQDVVDFFFSVQDFYHYNPQVYEDVIDNVDTFLNILHVLNLGTKYCDDYFDVAKQKKSEALNGFQALIFSIPDDTVVTEKLVRSHKRLETIMNKYFNQMYDICFKSLKRNGYSIFRHPPETGPDAYNKQVGENGVGIQKDFTFDFY